MQSLGPALLATLPKFLNPYLPRILRAILYSPNLTIPSSSSLPHQTDAFSLALASAVPARLLLPSLLEALSSLPSAGPAPVVLSLRIVTTHLSTRPSAEVQAGRAAAFEVLMGALSFRSDHTLSPPRSPPLPSAAAEGGRAVEASAGEALLALTTRLNEIQFRPLFLKALQWANADSE